MEEGQKKQEELKGLEDAQACVKCSITRLTTEIDAAKEDALQIELEIGKKLFLLGRLLDVVMIFCKSKLITLLFYNSCFDSWVETIEILGLECAVYCSRIHRIVNMCKGKMAAQ